MTTLAMLQDPGISRDAFEDLAARKLGPAQIRWATEPAPVAERARGARVIVTVNEPVDAEALRQVRPEMVAISFTGFDHVDLPAARELGVAVTNVPGYATDSVAELAVGMIIALMRRMVSCDNAVRQGRWREGLTGVELAGKTVGIVGTGATGIAVARRLAAFGCKLLGHSRTQRAEFTRAGGRYVGLDELLRRADVVSLHVPLSDETRGLIGARELAAMGDGALLVNTARGPVVDTAALAGALRAGSLGGAAVDVWDAEPAGQDNPLLDAPRTLLLPHVAFATAEALERKASITLDCIRSFLDGGRLHRVDGPV